MSDLQDAIASTAIKAFNEGYSRGVMAERERIIQLIEDAYNEPDFEEYGSFVFSSDIVELIKGEQK